MDSIVLSTHKLILLAANYPKENSEAFKACIEIYHPDSLLFHTPNVKESRKNAMHMCARPGYVNRLLYSKNLDKRLWFFDDQMH